MPVFEEFHINSLNLELRELQKVVILELSFRTEMNRKESKEYNAIVKIVGLLLI